MKSKFITVGLVQSKSSGNLKANLAKTEKMIRQAAKKGAQIICLQELFNIPYIPQVHGIDKDQYAEPVPGPTTESLKKLAKELGVVIIAPVFEKTRQGEYFNTAAVFDDRGGMLGKYHKVHMPHDPGFYERNYFQEGTSGYKIFKTKFGKFAVLICFDQWFPEAARAVKLAGAEMIFYPTAIANILDYIPPEGDWHDAWETVMRGHAIANSIPVIAANRTGVEGRSHFWGQSFICDAFGKILKLASPTKEQILVARLDLNMNEFISVGWGFLHDRRPDTYQSLVDAKLVKKTSRLNSNKAVAEDLKKIKQALEKKFGKHYSTT